MYLFYRELNSPHIGLKIKHIFNSIWKLTIFVSELGKSSPQHRGGIDAGDTDSVDLTPENHGPHDMNRKQMANVGKNAYKVPQLLFLTRQNLSNSYPNTATFAWLRMPYTAYGMLMPFSEYNENTIRKLLKAQNSSIQSNGEFPRKHCRKCQWRTLANRFEIPVSDILP